MVDPTIAKRVGQNIFTSYIYAPAVD